jgi:hypothetical protein
MGLLNIVRKAAAAGSRQPAAPQPDPTRTTWSVQMTGTCCGGHQCSTTMQVSAVNGSMGTVTACGQCGTCNSDVDLTGYIG